MGERGGGGEEMHTGFQWVNLKKRDNLQDAGADGRIILNFVINKYDERM
jgi:hypothetical protein